jgi:putative ABC transport system permease protein
MIFVQLLLRQWRQRPGRNLLSLLSVAIAVAAVLGTALAQSSVRSGSQALTADFKARASVDVVSADAGRFAETMMPNVANVAGIHGMFPVVTRATSGRINGKQFRGLATGIPASPNVAWELLPITEGHAFSEPDEAVMSAETAKALEASIGDRIFVITRRGPKSAKLVGTVSSTALREFAPGTSLLVPLETLQGWSAIDGQVDRVRLLLDEGVDRDAMRKKIAGLLGDQLVAQSAAGQAELIDSILNSTELALKFAGALSLALAVFIVVNTLRMNFGERRRQLAALRLIGATPRQMIWLHLLEGICLGVAGTAVGIPLGIGMGHGLATAMQRLLNTGVPSPELSASAIVTAGLLGPLLATSAALLPAWLSQKVSPAEALGDQDIRTADHIPLAATISAMVLWIIAMALVIGVVREQLSPNYAIPAGLIMLVAFITLLPTILRPLLRLMTRLLGKLGIEASLAAEQLLRKPTRSGLTVGVFVVALSNGIGLGNAVINNVDDVRDWFRRALAADYFLSDPAAQDSADLDRSALREQLAERPEIATVTEMRFFPARASVAGSTDASLPATAVVRDFHPDQPLPWVIDERQEASVRKSLAAGQIAASSVLAKKLDVHVGDSVRVELRGRFYNLTIATIVNDYMFGGMEVFLDQAAAKNLFETGAATVYLLELADAARVQSDEAPAWLESLAHDQGLTVQSFAQRRQKLDGIINGIVGALWALLSLAFLVGGFGVANTLAVSVLEQTREFGVLRTMGMTAGQIAKLVVFESMLFAFAGALMGGLAGATTALVIHLCNEPLLGHSMPFHFQWQLVALNIVAAFIVALAAAWLPARRASRLDLPAALAYE